MLDLMYMNILIVAFDILNNVLVYVNRVSTSHPIQLFSYTLKLRLEFIVLIQLMAVAARGYRRQPYEETRYFRRPGLGEGWDWDVSKFLTKHETNARIRNCDN